MRKHRITHYEAQQLLAGQAPAGRSEIVVLASSLEAFRAAAFTTVPQPSVALAARLGPPRGADISVATGGSSPYAAGGEAGSLTPAPAPQKKGKKRMFAWIAGLGLLAKLTVGAGTVALGLTGVGVAGAAGVLPGEVQTAFDEAVSVVLPAAEDEAAEDEAVEDEAVEDGAVTDAEAVEDEAVTDTEAVEDEAVTDAEDAGDDVAGIDDEESGRAQEELYRESGDTHDEADDVDEYGVDEESGRAQEDSYRQGDDAVEETQVVESDEVEVEQNVDSDSDSATDSGSASGSGAEVTAGSEADAQSATTSGGRP